MRYLDRTESKYLQNAEEGKFDEKKLMNYTANTVISTKRIKKIIRRRPEGKSYQKSRRERDQKNDYERLLKRIAALKDIGSNNRWRTKMIN